MTTAIELRQFSHDDLEEIRPTLLKVHADAYADRMHEDFVQRFPWFVNHWGGNSEFACVIAYDGDEPVGFTYGACATDDREWWRGHLEPAPANTSTFHLSELMVRPKWRKTGVSQKLHDALMGSRSEALAVLTVDTKRPKIQALYESWGYRKIGEHQPFPDSPLYAVMLLDLKTR